MHNEKKNNNNRKLIISKHIFSVHLDQITQSKFAHLCIIILGNN